MTKEWLNRGRMINKEINALMTQKNILHSRTTSTTSNLSNEPSSTSTINSNEAKFISYADFSKILEERIEELYKVKQEIINVINKLPKTNHRVLLIEYYINCRTWEDIAINIFKFKDNRQIYRLHNEALNMVKLKVIK